MNTHKCFFCGKEGLIRHDEHYLWCPDCHCIYTYMMIHSRGCDHIPGRLPDNCPVVTKLPDTPISWQEKIFIVDTGASDLQWCSKCGELCVADGW